MPTNQIDLSAKLKAFPYVAPAIVNAVTEAQEKASDIDKLISDLEESSSNIPTDISQIIGQGATPGAGVVGEDEWNRLAVPTDSVDWISGITDGLEKAFTALDKVTTIIQKVMRVIELFNSSFKSFSSLFVSVIDFAQSKIDEFSGSLQEGVYASVFAPPALLNKSSGDVNSRHELRGGFPGFLSRFESSIHNTKDDNRPTFTTASYVGGMVILVDTESIDKMWEGLQQLAAMFDFMQLLPINLSPPPPTNLRGFCGYFLDPAESELPKEERNKKFGVQIEWDNSFTSTAYHVYRSRVTGGTTTKEEFVPTSLVDNQETGEPGLLSVTADLLASIKRGKDTVKWPERIVNNYEDPDFNGGEPAKVIALPNLTSLKYIDTDILTEPIPDSGIEFAYIKEKDGTKVPFTNYYYMIRACGLTGVPEGPNSQELNVAIKTCNDNYNIADVIQHPEGRFEFLSVGAGKLNNWSSVRISGMIPWYVEIIEILSGFLDTLRGTVTDASDAFSGFMDQMTARIKMYRNILSVITMLIEQFKKFFFGPSLALLNLPPEKGGMPVFVERVKQAQVPEGSEGFSGPDGITVGIVLVYGGGALEVVLFEKAFQLIESLLTED